MLNLCHFIQAAERELYAECGKKMDTWVVSKNPIGVYQPSPSDQVRIPAFTAIYQLLISLSKFPFCRHTFSSTRPTFSPVRYSQTERA